MRMRYRYVTYRYSDGSQQQLERHYRQLLQDALRQSQQSILQHSVTWRPLADIHESLEMMTVKIELAGMKEEDIEVTLYEDALVVSGERHDDHESLLRSLLVHSHPFSHSRDEIRGKTGRSSGWTLRRIFVSSK